MNNAALEFLQKRRSARPFHLAEPGPSHDQLDEILKIAARVPDHKALAPWRFIVFEGEARAKMGDIIAAACQAEDADGEPSEARLQTERERLQRAPVVVAVISHVKQHPAVPEWEQIISAGNAAFALCLAANALGFKTAWLTEWIAYSPRVREAMQLADNERITGFVYIGTPKEQNPERKRPEIADLVARWEG